MYLPASNVSSTTSGNSYISKQDIARFTNPRYRTCISIYLTDIELGFAHSAFTFAYESQITKSSVASAQVNPSMIKPVVFGVFYNYVSLFRNCFSTNI